MQNIIHAARNESQIFITLHFATNVFIGGMLIGAKMKEIRIMAEKQNKRKNQAMLFLISQCITLFGSTLVQMAVVWYVTIQTSSGVWIAAFTVCSYLPQFLISFVAGVWADRHSRKKLIICADSVIALVTLLMAVAIPHITDGSVVLGGLLVMSVRRS